MAARYAFAGDRNLIVVRLADAITGDEIAETIRRFSRDVRWKDGTFALWDGRSVRETVVDMEEVDRIAEAQREAEQLAGSGRAAVVVTRWVDDLVARLIIRHISSERREIRVFEDMGEARRWLGVADVLLPLVTAAPGGEPSSGGEAAPTG